MLVSIRTTFDQVFVVFIQNEIDKFCNFSFSFNSQNKTIQLPLKFSQFQFFQDVHDG